MLPLREATKLKHKEVEQMPFNIKMFKGELSESQYMAHLKQQFAIFEAIEKKALPNPNLARLNAVQEDISELIAKGYNSSELTKNTLLYTNYLNRLDSEEILPHIYLNYLAIAFGGQQMKRKVPSSGKMYKFNNKREAILSVRNVQKDDWADEVNKAYDYIIRIYKDLETYLK